MIQRYGVFKKPGDDSVHSHDLIYKECDTGDIILYDHVKDQLEWRKLTEKCRPADHVQIRVWIKDGDCVYSKEESGILATRKNGKVEFEGHGGEGVIDKDDIFSDESDVSFRWQPTPLDPWENKQ